MKKTQRFFLTDILEKPSLHKHIILGSASLAYLGKQVWFYVSNPQFEIFWDLPGHIQKAHVTNWPWISGWDTTFWGGYPTALYPSLSHSLLTLVSPLTNERWGVIITSILFSLLTMHSLYIFIRSKVQKPILIGLTYLCGLAISTLVDATILGSLKGTLLAGGYAAALATPLFLYFMATSHWIYKGLFLGLIALTHNITFSVALLVLLIETVLYAVDKKSNLLKNHLFTLLTGCVIGLPWILTYLDPSFVHAAQNIGQQVHLLPMLLVFLLFVFALEGKSLRQPLVVSTIVLGLITLTPTWLAVHAQIIGIKGIHAYRYLWFFYLLFPTALVQIIENKNIIRLKLSKSSILLSTCIILLIILSTKFPTYNARLSLNEDLLKNVSGRVMDASDQRYVASIPYAIDHEIIKKSKLIGSTGLFYESSPFNLLFFTLKYNLNKFSRVNGASGSFFASISSDNDREVLQRAEILGINYITFSTNSELKSEANIHAIGKVGLSNKTETVYLAKITDTQLIEPLKTYPAVDKNMSIDEWWGNTPSVNNLYIRDDVETPYRDKPSPGSVKNINISPQSINFSVDAPQPVPLNIKFTYSPYWKAQSRGGSTTQPVWISPGFMYIVGNGDISLEWTPPQYIQVYSKLSVATLIIMISLVVSKPFHKLNKST